jgi:hypothetical protein
MLPKAPQHLRPCLHDPATAKFGTFNEPAEIPGPQLDPQDAALPQPPTMFPAPAAAAEQLRGVSQAADMARTPEIITARAIGAPPTAAECPREASQAGDAARAPPAAPARALGAAAATAAGRQRGDPRQGGAGQRVSAADLDRILGVPEGGAHDVAGLLQSLQAKNVMQSPGF